MDSGGMVADASNQELQHKETGTGGRELNL